MNQIRRLRFENGEMSQQELAGRAGCTRQTIGALEQGGYVPSMALGFRIARVFGLDITSASEVITKSFIPRSIPMVFLFFVL